MKKITSAANPRLKAAIRLKSTRGRKTQQRIIVYGQRELPRAIASGLQVVEVFVCPELLTAAELEAVNAAIPAVAVTFELAASLIARLRYGELDDGVVAIAQRPHWPIGRLVARNSESPNPLVVVLESMEKPGNIGAVLRTLDGAGATAAIVADPLCDVFHPNCIRASMGSLFTIPLAIASAAEARAWCSENGIAIYGLTDQGASDYASIDWRGPSAIALGNEATGLSRQWLAPPVKTVSIPMLGVADSLNVSVAAAVVVYEARRQRRNIE